MARPRSRLLPRIVLWSVVLGVAFGYRLWRREQRAGAPGAPTPPASVAPVQPPQGGQAPR